MIDDNKMFEVESAIGSIFGVSQQDILGKSRKGACVKARHLSIYILHRNYSATYRVLTRRYKISDRLIRHIGQRWDYYISTLKEFEQYYLCAVNLIKNDMPDLSLTH